jgi:hypothetical protein
MNHPGILALALALPLPAPGHCAGAAPDRLRAQQAPHTQVGDKKQALPPRRSVPARIPETLIVPSTTTQVPLARPPSTTTPRPAPPAQADRPSPLTGCDPGGCWDSGGNRYNGGAGNTYLNGAGKLCTRNGAWMQCF